MEKIPLTGTGTGTGISLHGHGVNLRGLAFLTALSE